MDIKGLVKESELSTAQLFLDQVLVNSEGQLTLSEFLELIESHPILKNKENHSKLFIFSQLGDASRVVQTISNSQSESYSSMYEDRKIWDQKFCEYFNSKVSTWISSREFHNYIRSLGNLEQDRTKRQIRKLASNMLRKYINLGYIEMQKDFPGAKHCRYRTNKIIPI